MNVTYDFYSGTYGGECSEQVIAPYLKTAALQAECAVTIPLSAADEEHFAYAVCIQADALKKASEDTGSSTAMTADGEQSWGLQLSSLKLGNFSVSCTGQSNSSSGGTSSGNASSWLDGGTGRGGLCPLAAAYLERYGLLYRGGIML